MSVCPSGGLRTPSAQRGGRGLEKAKIKKKGRAAKAGAKTAPNSATAARWWCLLFLRFLYRPSRLRDHRHAGPVPQIQTNSSGSYRRSNKCRTFTFSSEGSATVSPPPPPVTNHPFVPPPQSPRFSTMSLFLQLPGVSFLARVPARGSRPVTRAHVYATLLCTMVSPAQSTVSSAPGFLALANFPLLNVNFDVIDGAATAWMLAYSLSALCPTLFTIILAEFGLILGIPIVS